MIRANLVQGNALNIPLADGVVQTVVTSPPYYGLRDYSADGQLGLEPTLAEYIENMVAVFDEVWRVLRDDGTVWLNMGDSYARAGGWSDNSGLDGKARGESGRAKTYNNVISPGFKEKDLMMVPHRLAIALQSAGDYEREARAIGRAMDAITAGYDEEELPDKVMVILEGLLNEYAELKYAAHSWYVRSDIVWHKPNPMPESVTDRPTKSHEYIFLLSKSRKYYYDADAVREENKPESIKRAEYGFNPEVSGHSYWHQEGSLFKPPQSVQMNPLGRNRRSVWTITTKPYSGAHFATFPPEIPEVCIKAGTSEKGQCPECGAPWERVAERTKYEPEEVEIGVRFVDESRGDKTRKLSGSEYNKSVRVTGEYWQPTCGHDHEPVPQIVFDPFNGSGTTVEVAQRLGRIGVGLDLSWDYLQLARERTGLAALDEWQHGRKAQEANLEGLPMFKGSL